MDRLFAGLDSFGSGASSVGSSTRDTFPVISKPPDVPPAETTGQLPMFSGWSIPGTSGTGTTPTSSAPADSGLLGGGSQLGSRSSSMGAAQLQSTSVYAAPTASATSSSAMGLLQNQTEGTSLRNPPTSVSTKPLQPMQPLQPFQATGTAGNATGMGGWRTGSETMKPQASVPSLSPTSTAGFNQMTGVGVLQPTSPASSTFGLFQESRQGQSSGLGGFDQVSTSSRPMDPLKPQPNMSSPTSPMTSPLSQPMTGFPPLQPTSKSGSFGNFQQNKPQPVTHTGFGQGALSSKPLEPMKPQAAVPSSTFPMTSQPMSVNSSMFGRVQDKQPQPFTTPGPATQHATHSSFLEPQPLRPSPLVSPPQPTSTLFASQPVSTTVGGQASMFSTQTTGSSWSQHQNPGPLNQASIQSYPGSSSGMRMTTSVASPFSQQPLAAVPFQPQSLQPSTMSQNVSGLGGLQPQPTATFQGSSRHPRQSQSLSSGFGQSMSGSGLLQPVPQQQPSAQSTGFGFSSGVSQNSSLPQNQWSLGGSASTMVSQGMSSINWTQPQAAQSVGPLSAGSGLGQPTLPQQHSQLFGLQSQGMLQPTPSVLNPNTLQPRMPMPMQPTPGDNPFGSMDNLH